MTIDAKTLKAMINDDLASLSDARVITHIRDLLVEPTPVLRNWDYGKEGEQYVCWTVLNEAKSKIGIAYCESGFGPRCPWGLVWLEGDKLWMGQDSAWYPSFLQAYFESAAADLPIWRVFKSSADGTREAITNKDSWDNTWKEITARRELDPTSRYDCDHSISFKKK